MRVVLDTNVLFSAFLWKKRLKPIYRAIRQKHLTPCFSRATWQEFQRDFYSPQVKLVIELDGVVQAISETLVRLRPPLTPPS